MDANAARVLDELAAAEASIAADAEAQRAASEVAGDLQLLLARMIALGDVATLESLRAHIGVASFDDAVALARQRGLHRLLITA
jgi:hypothetical protein